MNALQSIAGQLAGAVALAAFFPYIVSVVRGRTRPNLVTWLIWTAVGAIILASYWAAGARATLWVAVGNVIGPFAIAVLALRYGERSWSRFDVLCLGAAAGSLALWGLTGDPLLALVLNVLVDLIGGLPTLRKCWLDPGSEDRLAWTLFFTANSINLVAVEAWTVAGALYPLYLFGFTVVMNALLWRPARRLSA